MGPGRSLNQKRRQAVGRRVVNCSIPLQTQLLFNMSISNIQPAQPTERLSKLNQLEQSLKSMQLRIQSLLKEQSRAQKGIKKAFDESVHHIGYKIAQTEFQQHLKTLRKRDKQNVEKKHEQITELKMRHSEELDRIVQTMRELKKKESESIKEQSKKNDCLIQQNRRRNIECKKQNVEKLKEIRQQTRRQMSNQKLQRLRESQIEKKQKRQDRLEQAFGVERKLKQYQDMEAELLAKIKQSTEASQSIHEASEQTSRVPSPEFYKIIRQVKRKKRGATEDDLKKLVFEKFLEKQALSASPAEKAQSTKEDSTSRCNQLSASPSK